MLRLKLLLLTLCCSLPLGASAQTSGELAALEAKLFSADSLSLDFQVTATGAVQASISGTLKKSALGEVHLSAKGDFAGQDVDLIVTRDQQGFRFGKRDAPASAEAPTELWRALIFGFTRMGILHNIANLTADAMPDHAEDGVDEWVTVSNVVAADAFTYSFDITVADIPSGSATLALAENGDPITREQTVKFPGGEMKVVETYTNILMNE